MYNKQKIAQLKDYFYLRSEKMSLSFNFSTNSLSFASALLRWCLSQPFFAPQAHPHKLIWKDATKNDKGVCSASISPGPAPDNGKMQCEFRGLAIECVKKSQVGNLEIGSEFGWIIFG